MGEHMPGHLTRRRFLEGTLAAVSTLPFVPVLSAVSSAASTVALRSPQIEAIGLTAGEAAFTEALVRVRCPEDHLTADGVASGLAAAIEGHLAVADDTEIQRQRESFSAGIAAADRVCRTRLGAPFHELAPGDAREMLRSLASGEIETEFPFASWSSDIVDRLLTQACFSGPVYEVYGTTMFWKLFG